MPSAAGGNPRIVSMSSTGELTLSSAPVWLVAVMAFLAVLAAAAVWATVSRQPADERGHGSAEAQIDTQRSPVALDSLGAFKPEDQLADWHRSSERVLLSAKISTQILYIDRHHSVERRNIIINALIKVRHRDDLRYYVDACCISRKAARRFRLDRITEVVDPNTGELFDDAAAIVGWFTSIVDSETRRRG